MQKYNRQFLLKKIFFILFITIIALNILNIYSAKAQQTNRKISATVIRVIDGDTLKIAINKKIESLRLIGIDAPESRKNKKAYRDISRMNKDLDTIIKMGKQSTEYVKTLLKPGDIIFVEFDIQLRDKYGRLLGYIYLDDGIMLNEEILKAGYATLTTIPPNVKYVSKFYQAYLYAKKNKKGLWKY